jgi:hypothetical protein
MNQFQTAARKTKQTGRKEKREFLDRWLGKISLRLSSGQCFAVTWSHSIPSRTMNAKMVTNP